MIDKEDESMGFLQRGTVYDQHTRRSVYMGFETQERILTQRVEVEGYDTYGNPVLNHPEPRSESVARGEAWGYDVPREHYRQVTFAAEHQVEEEQYGGSVNVYDNNVRSIHHRRRLLRVDNDDYEVPMMPDDHYTYLRPLGDSRSRHTEDMERHDELTGQPGVGDGIDTLP